MNKSWSFKNYCLNLPRQPKKEILIQKLLFGKEEKGLSLWLIESHVKGKKQFYLARLPEEAFNNFFEQKEDRLDEQKLVFQKLLPKLTKTAKKRNFNTKVTFWEGREGIISMVKKIIEQKEDLYWYGSFEAIISMVGEDKFYKKMTLERLKQKTTAYAITNKNIHRFARFSERLGNFRQFRFLDKEFKTPAILVIFGNYICLASQKEKDIKAVLVEDSLMAEIMLSMFWDLWQRIPAKSLI